MLMLMVVAEIAKRFGSDATESAIMNVVKRQVRPAVKSIEETLANGGDPKDLEFPWWNLSGANGSCFAIS